MGIPEKWDLGPRTLHLGSFTQDQDQGPIDGTRHLYVGLRTWYPSPVTRDPICGYRDPIPSRETWDPHLGIVTLIQLSLNMKFSSVA